MPPPNRRRRGCRPPRRSGRSRLSRRAADRRDTKRTHSRGYDRGYVLGTPGGGSGGPFLPQPDNAGASNNAARASPLTRCIVFRDRFTAAVSPGAGRAKRAGPANGVEGAGIGSFQEALSRGGDGGADAFGGGSAKARPAGDGPIGVQHVVDCGGEPGLNRLEFGERKVGEGATDLLGAPDDPSGRMVRLAEREPRDAHQPVGEVGRGGKAAARRLAQSLTVRLH